MSRTVSAKQILVRIIVKNFENGISVSKNLTRIYFTELRETEIGKILKPKIGPKTFPLLRRYLFLHSLVPNNRSKNGSKNITNKRLRKRININEKQK